MESRIMTSLEYIEKHFNKYPHIPGYKAQETSKAAATAIKPRAKKLRDQVLDALKGHEGGATPDAIAEELGITILSVRPRITELKLKGLIEDSGRRGKTDCGKASIIWICVCS